MIPLELRLRGLHSFREEQSLDFGEVLGHGVFGIFGPTGSGKSTVLDAITLALYGRVERAPSGTQGICNQAEDRLEVGFSFALEGAEGLHRYRAERSYARQGSADAVRTAKCRLSELDAAGGSVVLADSAREMTQAVEGIIGLTVEDFTRAVVLPQGRFAEFLGLGGVERRRMLQRLFGLERYGDALSARVKQRLDEAAGALGVVTAEQGGLGDASAAALRGAEAQQAGAQATAALAAAALSAAQAEREAAGQVWGWQAELGQVGAGEARLAAAEPTVRAEEAELRAAGSAEQVRPLLEAALEARQALAAATARAQEAGAAATGQAAAAEEARRAWDERRLERAGRDGALQERRIRLAEAVRTEAGLEAARAQLAEAEAALAAAEAERALALQAAERAEGERLAAREQARQAQVRLQDIRVDPAERSRVEAAAQALQDQRRAAAALAEARQGAARAQEEAAVREVAAASAAGERAEAERAHAEADEARRQLGEAPDAGTAGWAEALAAASAVLEAVRRAEGDAVRAGAAVARARSAAEAAAAARWDADTAAADVAAALERARAALDDARQRGLAGSLASGLREGEPCPVCGSAHHPAPAAPEAAGIATAQEAVAGAEGSGETARALCGAALGAEAAAGATVDGELRAEGRAAEALGEARRELDRRLEAFPASVRALGGDELAGHIRAEEDQLRRRQAAQLQWQAALAGADRRREEALRAFFTVQRGAAEQEGAAAGARGALEAATAALRRAEAAEAPAAVALEACRGAWPDEAIVEAQQGLQRREREAGELLERLSVLSAAAEAAEQAAGQARTAVEAGRAAAEGRREAARALAAEAERLRGEVEGATGGGPPPAEQLAEVEAERQALAEAETRAQAAADGAAAALAAARSAEAAAAAERTGSARRAEADERKLASARAEAAFDGEEAVRAALRPEAARADLRGRVESHAAERQRLSAERQRLQQQLGGRSLSPAEWAEAGRRLEAAAEAGRGSQEALGVARQILEATRERHGRWQGLETRRVVLEGARGALADLQGVLRGAAFVDFIAEEQLRSVALDASARLGQLTAFRYALEVDAQGGFCIRDDWNGGTRRPVSTLSGGETFLTSLALALALSAQIQLRGRYPLQFFFLDEGFGTLDPETLDTAMAALERLQADRVHIGVISHVPEVRARLNRRVVVEPARPGGPGSRLRVEVA